MCTRRLIACVTAIAILAACNPDDSNAKVPSGETRFAGAVEITADDDIAQFDSSHTESVDVDADGWHVTAATRGYVTGDGLSTNAKTTQVRLAATVSGSDDYPSVLCFADDEMLGGYDIRFADGRVTLVDSRSDGELIELDVADIDLTNGLSAIVTCESFDDASAQVTVTVTDDAESTLLSFRDPSPDRREGRVAVRVAGGSTVTVFQALLFSTTSA